MTQQQALLIAAAVFGGVMLATMQNADAVGRVEDWASDGEDPNQSAGAFDSFATWSDPGALFDSFTVDPSMANRQAFLNTIAYSEGTDKPGGYFALFGWPAQGRTFTSTADHPRVLFPYTDKAGKTIKTSAAGRYQITRTTFDDVAPSLGIRSFTPADQDAIAVELIRQRGALPDVDAGRFAQAIDKVRRVWASLPGAGYNQPERDINKLAAVYVANGGVIQA